MIETPWMPPQIFDAGSRASDTSLARNVAVPISAKASGSKNRPNGGLLADAGTRWDELDGSDGGARPHAARYRRG